MHEGRHCFLEKRQSLRRQIRHKKIDTCDGPARVRQTFHHMLVDQVCYPNDRDRGARVAQRIDARSDGDQDIDMKPHQFSSEVFHSRIATLTKSIFDKNILALDVAQIAKPLPKTFYFVGIV